MDWLEKEAILGDIEDATSLKELNDMRMDIVQAKDGEVLKAWQDKFWAYKKCPECGKVR